MPKKQVEALLKKGFSQKEAHQIAYAQKKKGKDRDARRANKSRRKGK